MTTTPSEPPDARHADTERLRHWNRWVQPLVIVAAVLPLGPVIAGTDPTTAPEASVAVACWLVFVIDFIAQYRLRDDFLGAWRGRLYLVIVVITAPVYLVIPSLDETDLLALARLGWVAVLITAAADRARGVGRLARRLGLAGLYAVTAVIVGAFVAYRVESPDDGFETFGDSLWWSIVTITTVGYGDLAPVTTTGRITAVGLMIAGLAFLGVAAASLTAFFRVEDTEPAGHDDRPVAQSAPQPGSELVGEIRALRADVAQLDRRVEVMANQADDRNH